VTQHGHLFGGFEEDDYDCTIVHLQLSKSSSSSISERGKRLDFAKVQKKFKKVQKLKDRYEIFVPEGQRDSSQARRVRKFETIFVGRSNVRRSWTLGLPPAMLRNRRYVLKNSREGLEDAPEVSAPARSG
jgi:hypothetical protein